MLKTIGLAFISTLLLLSSWETQHPMFSKYKAIEAYEVRPRILMMPTFSPDGQLCEVGLEKRHYTPKEVFLSPDLSHGELPQIIEELAPVKERGPRPTNQLEREGVTIEGNTMDTSSEYEKVSIHIYSEAEYDSEGRRIGAHPVVATITWKRPECK